MNDQPVRRPLKLPDRHVELSLVDWGGSGQLALLIHATGFCTATFAVVARQLRSRYRVVGYDARGHGDSTKFPPPEPYEWNEFIEDLVAVARTLLKELGISRVGLGVGHSFGGDCLLAAAARNPELFEQIVLIEPIVEPPVGERTGFYAGEGPHPLAESARKRRAIFASREEARQRWSARGPFSDWDPRVLQLYLDHGLEDLPDGQVALKCPAEIEASVYEAGPNFHIFSEIAQLQTKTTLYRATRGYSPPALIERLAAASEYVKLIVVEGGHLLPMTVPDVVAACLLLSWQEAIPE
jgi:pimeloyl-ACP methyl ester carboxylesterase